MSEQNRNLAIRWFNDVWNLRLERIIEEMIGPDVVGHMEGAEVVGPAQFKTARTAILTAFPDLQVTVEATAADGDDVAVRWRANGTHRGNAFGIDATGATVGFRGMTWLTMKEGRLIEGWDAWNMGALLESLRVAAPRSSNGGS
jgi:steroid delta-isomerase-like uncharacterized protein